MFGKDKEAARIGLAAHTAVLHKLVSKGLEVLQPLGDHLRYDLAYYWDENAELVRIQCKAGRYEPDIMLCWGNESSPRTYREAGEKPV